MNQITPEALLNILRVVALSCNDSLIESYVLDAIGESKAEVVEELGQTCWGEDIDFSRHLTAVREDLRSEISSDMEMPTQLSLLH